MKDKRDVRELSLIASRFSSYAQFFPAAKNLEKNLELHAFREYDKVQQLTKGQRWKKTGEH